MTTDELQTAIQKVLDTKHPGMDRKIHVFDNLACMVPECGPCYTFTITRSNDILMDCYFMYEEEGLMCLDDAKFLTGDDNLQIPISDLLYLDSGHHYSVSIGNFSEAYSKQCKNNGASEPEDIEIVQSFRGAMQFY